MARDSISKAGFTLLEVIVAVGLLAVTVVALLGLHRTLIRSTGAVSDRERAAQLADAITIELERLRDLRAADGTRRGLDGLAAMIPAAGSTDSLRLVGSREGCRVTQESGADDPVAGLRRAERFFMIEVRQPPPPLNYSRNAGFLAVTLAVHWPYLIASGPDSNQAIEADPALASILVLNDALMP